MTGRYRVRMPRRAWTEDNPPPLVRQMVDWWVHERHVGEKAAHFAEKAGVSVHTVHQYMVDPRVKRLLGMALEESNASMPKVQEVLDMLFRRATQEDDVRAAKTYLEAVGRMAPRRMEVTINDARELSNEQLAVELRRAISLVEAQRALPAVEIEDAEVIEDVA